MRAIFLRCAVLTELCDNEEHGDGTILECMNNVRVESETPDRFAVLAASDETTRRVFIVQIEGSDDRVRVSFEQSGRWSVAVQAGSGMDEVARGAGTVVDFVLPTDGVALVELSIE